METDSAPSSLSAPKQTSQMIYKVHPLVLLNISEHWTRTKSQNRTKNEKVFGAIMGVQDGRVFEVHNSFAVPVENIDEQPFIINEEHYKTRVEQYKKVFPELEPLGWYTTDEDEGVSDIDRCVHRQFCQWIDAPIFSKLIVSNDIPSHKLPLVVFESISNEPSDQTPAHLRSVDWTLVSEESERIGVDHVSRLSQASSSANKSELAKQIRSTGCAAEMLKKRMNVIREYLRAVESHKLPADKDILKEANKILQQLPLMESDDLDAHFRTEVTDVNCALLVPDMVKMCGALQHLVHTTNVMANDRVPVLGAPLMKTLAKSQKMTAPDIFNV